MNNRFKKTYLSITLLLSSFSLTAQVNDAGLWINLDVEKKITQKFSAQFTHSIRFYENYTELGTSFSELGATYKILKPLTVGGYYRYAKKKKVDDFYSTVHRYSFHLSYKYKYKNFKFALREQYQSSYKDFGVSETGSIPKKYLRTKVSVNYDLEKKYSPFISYELFYEIGEYIDNTRYKAGVDYEFNKFNSINIYYMIDKEKNVKNPWTSYVLGLGYNFTF